MGETTPPMPSAARADEGFERARTTLLERLENFEAPPGTDPDDAESLREELVRTVERFQPLPGESTADALSALRDEYDQRVQDFVQDQKIEALIREAYRDNAAEQAVASATPGDEESPVLHSRAQAMEVDTTDDTTTPVDPDDTTIGHEHPDTDDTTTPVDPDDTTIGHEHPDTDDTTTPVEPDDTTDGDGGSPQEQPGGGERLVLVDDFDVLLSSVPLDLPRADPPPEAEDHDLTSVLDPVFDGSDPSTEPTLQLLGVAPFEGDLPIEIGDGLAITGSVLDDGIESRYIGEAEANLGLTFDAVEPVTIELSIDDDDAAALFDTGGTRSGAGSVADRGPSLADDLASDDTAGEPDDGDFGP
jgi:hypothetical protein